MTNPNRPPAKCYKVGLRNEEGSVTWCSNSDYCDASGASFASRERAEELRTEMKQYYPSIDYFITTFLEMPDDCEE